MRTMTLKGHTKRIIAEGLFAVNQTKPLSKITVSDIVQASGINRNTFYYYFLDKNDLVSWIYARTVSVHYSGEADAFSQEHTERVFGVFKEHRKFYREAFSEYGVNSFDDFMRKYWVDLFTQTMKEETGAEPGNEDLFAIKSFCYSRIDLLKEWVLGDCKMDTAEFTSFMVKDVPPCLLGLTYKPHLTNE